MDKVDHKSKDILGGNVEKIAELFPGVVTEAVDEATGELRKVVDFDLLRQHLSDELVEGDRERFRLDWPGKKASILKANTPTTKTLRPVREDSEDFDTTQNVFIEGDNFEVLKVLQESYLGKIKMIYIDPPYNTGKDFIYKDNFAADREDYEEEIGVRDDENGGKLVKNTETNGRYHSDWLSMMQERLIVARDLLTDDGIIFISIDDNEQANLKKLCDEIFGEENFINKFTWVNKPEGRQIQQSGAAGTHEFIYCYAKQSANINEFTAPVSYLNSLMPRSYGDVKRDVKMDSKGEYIITHELYNGNAIFNEETRPSLVFDIYYRDSDKDIKIEDVSERHVHDGYVKIKPHRNPNGTHKYNAYRWSKDKILAEKQNLEFVKSGETFKIFTKRRDFNKTNVKDIITGLTTKNGSSDVMDLGINEFDFPKPTRLIEFLIKISQADGVILDFFSGSATTAHAVMLLNAKDGGSRRHIQVQLAEATDEKSKAYKAGYKSIPEISRERIRRAAKKIREDYAEQIAKRDTPLDTGFRAYRLSSSNFVDTAQHPAQTAQASLLDTTDNIKDDRTPEDLLTEVILDLGLTLDLPIEHRDIAGHSVFFVGGNSLVACFDDSVSLDIVDGIAAEKPLRVVFKDSSFANDETRINIDIRLKQLSPDTTVQVV